MIDFGDKNMMEIVDIVSTQTKKLKNKEQFKFIISNIDVDYKGWVDLSQMVFCKMMTPQIDENNNLIMCYEKLNQEDSFHSENEDVEEKYGSSSTFATIDKNKQPAFLVHYLKALENVKLDTRIRVLNLGVNSGEEFEVIKKYSKNFENLELVGIDYCSSAIEEAKKNFDDENISFLVGDINDLVNLSSSKYE